MIVGVKLNYFIVSFCWTLGQILTEGSGSSLEKDTFEKDFDGWRVLSEDNSDGWFRKSVKELQRNFTDFPKPLDTNSHMVIVPSLKPRNKEHVITKEINVPANSNLKVFFSCLVLGWNDSRDILIQMDNPTLRVIYDESVVFNLKDAIVQNLGHYMNGQWNQFRLYSSYGKPLKMNITLAGSHGNAPERSLIAVDNIIFKITKNETISNRENVDAEPEAEVQETLDGEWERLETISEEEESEVELNDTLRESPEYCILPPDPGPCHASWPRYFFNSSAETCQKFMYSGCFGNDNNFHEKLACEAICKDPKDSEARNVLSQHLREKITALELDFENGFDDWDQRFWKIVRYDSPTAHRLNASIPLNISSKVGAYPVSNPFTILRRPQLSHAIDLTPESNLTIRFSLKNFYPVGYILHPFFDHLNPGIRIYVGDVVIFDFKENGIKDSDWHVYHIFRNTSEILKDSWISKDRKTRQLIRFEAWGGNSKSGIILDDLKIVQTHATQPLIKSTSFTVSIPTTSLPTQLNSSASSSTTTHASKSRRFLPFHCSHPMDSGPCKVELSRYFYDAVAGTCKQFTYGGCKGNTNNFITEADCISQCIEPKNVSEDFCQMREDVGPCKDYLERYFYDPKVNSCSIFMYGGCGGNENNFVSKEECMHVCGSSKNLKEAAVNPISKTSLDCSLPIQFGNCDDNFTMYGFDVKQRKCVAFQYSGCGGNENLFFSLTQCNRTCSSLLIGAADKCQFIYPSHEFCNGSMGSELAWSFDKTFGDCLEVQTCSGNTLLDGQFKSKRECQDQCLKNKSVKKTINVQFELADCLLPAQPGNCGFAFSRYFYNKSDSTCQPFNFSGCDGNKNNFFSQQECFKTCSGVERKILKQNVSICEEPKEVGSCLASIQRYYYDIEAQTCLNFTYSGCGGNRNRFRTLSDCEITCYSSQVTDAISKVVSRESKFISVAEVIIAMALITLAIVGIGLGIKYKRMRDANEERYRIFQNEQNNRESVASFEAHENPAYEGNIQQVVDEIEMQDNRRQEMYPTHM